MLATCLLAGGLAAAAPPAGAPAIGTVDLAGSQYLPEPVLRQHFAQYCANGTTTLRAPISWSDQETTPGTWRQPTWLPYLHLAVATGFRLTLDMETIAAPPAWFIAAHPDARLVDQNGVTTNTQMISYWYPGLHALLHEKADRLLAMLAATGVSPSITSVVASLGPADEPLYPPQWVLGPNAPQPGFWWFDRHAEADYPRRMAERYGTLAAANAAWRTSYAAWSDVHVPKPGTVGPAQWHDTLDWYRDTKRRFVAWQLADTQDLVARYWPTDPPRVVVVVPGTHIPGDEWARALQAPSSSDPVIVQMNDTDFLIDAASAAHASLHVTGMPENEELQYIRAYMRTHDADVPISGENVGVEDASPWAAELTAETLGYDLAGFDYLYGSSLFAADRTTTTPALEPVARMQHDLADAGAATRASLSLPRNFTLIQDGCVDIAPASDTTLCLSAAGTLALRQGEKTLWTAAAPAQTCPTGLAWTQSCRATLQADGNLVFYNGATPYWNTATSAGDAAHQATRLLVSASPPYLSLLNAAGAPVWTSQAGKLF